ncbi:restriction endonuclease type II-like protein [Formosa agariphila KMM 3901]|uniref:UPF0102 protein BN863_1210 n=1 Tax=Formosa agariphila (strain DSM 15362 / KCTC 12365 / LMG 23005 / KMM 3901 / M-2Alg 35-1) TaxID=1347342 RepID=T2KHG5_FORAG|nr:YraN family protein [Formosa agariphila]CDF77833.1 restriction endonuclease type II-like protein [Formosa agariphila KMM 3901]
MADHNRLGTLGEEEAVHYLLKKGYHILERNYRYQRAEVDILAMKENILAVVEVKTRSTSVFGNPQDFVKPKQIQRLVTAVDAYVTSNNLDVDVRFDIIAIINSKDGLKIEHLEDAFYHF